MPTAILEKQLVPQLDESAVTLAKAIRNVETQGTKDPFNAKGGSGEWGAYQYTKDTWDNLSKKHGVSAQFGSATSQQQNEVAYKEIKELKDKGHNVGQIASIWNSGKPEWEGNIGVNKYGVKYDTPQYVKSVAKTYHAYKAGYKNPTIDPTTSTVKDQPVPLTAENANQTGATFPSREGESATSAAFKTLGNMPKSAFGFAKGAISILNPVSIFGNIAETKRLLEAESQRTGENPLSIFAKSFKETPKSAYEVLVPEFGKGLAEAGVSAIQGDSNKALENLERAKRSVVNDPVGSILPFLLLAEGVAKSSPKYRAQLNTYKTNYKSWTDAGKQGPPPAPPKTVVDTAISKTAQVVTKPVGYAFRGAGEMVSGATKFVTGQATGLQPTTISEVIKNPKYFTKESRGIIDRSSLGNEVETNLKQRISSLKETGEAYAPIRNRTTPIKVNSNFLEENIKSLTGLELEKSAPILKRGELPKIDVEGNPVGGKGTFKSSASAIIREAKDVRAIQTFYEKYQPLFEKGKMTTNEFLNMRTDLAKLSNFEREIGKSQPVEAVSQILRGKINSAYRGQLKGLKTLDESFATQSVELKSLRKGLVDKNGQLTDSAINKISNAVGKGKDLLIERLEQISPGITHKIRILKAMEDIENASGIKVGTYTRAIITGGIGLTAGLIPAIIGMILTSPEVAVPLLRKYGLLKNSRVVGSILITLKETGAGINQLPEGTEKLQEALKKHDISVGLSIKDVSKFNNPYEVKIGSINPNYPKSITVKVKDLVPMEWDNFTDLRKPQKPFIFEGKVLPEGNPLTTRNVTINSYKSKMLKREPVSPALVIKHIDETGTWYEVQDGHHKITAAKELGITEFPVQIMRTIQKKSYVFQ